jgi:NAD(P)-dependent dehydrogenase (short-subunit alcohol dehydrogenase family)
VGFTLQLKQFRLRLIMASFTLTSGKMGDKPSKNAVGKAIVNGGINSFVLAASLEMQRGIRINAVSPGKVSDTATEDLAEGYIKKHRRIC